MLPSPVYSSPPPTPTKLGRNRTLSPLAGPDESSDAFIGPGAWAESRGIRGVDVQINYSLHHNLILSAFRPEMRPTSLKKLHTTYIDILFVHWWDYTTSVEEVVNSLHVLVQQGKVLYHSLISAAQGIADTPAWVVSKANQYAKDHGKTPFCTYQGNWSVLDRSLERDIIPMVRSEGIALAPFGVLGSGKIRTNAEEARRRESGERNRVISRSSWERTPERKRIIGDRKVEQLKENLAALVISLATEQVKRIEDATPFDPGFPHTMIGNGTYDYITRSLLDTDRVPLPLPITPTTQ
ncbi:NADP-dependent oxidoreductase domain-containing protein [Lactarius quietus]|nr:NADP-dependent oxidoreductase domain-containing protein [Lactarius quietus]